MAKKRQAVTAAEWEVLEPLWSEAPLSAREVYERLGSRQDGSPQTVRTLLERLLEKGVVSRRDAHGIWVFRPARKRAEVVREEARRFLGRFFDGQPALGAAHFIEHEELSPEELRRLRKLVDSRLRGNDGSGAVN